MKRRFRKRIGLVVGMVLPGLLASAYAAGAGWQDGGGNAKPKRSDATTAPSASALVDRLEGIRAQHNVPALGAALVRDGKLVEVAVSGTTEAGGAEPVLPDDAWHIGSDTKAMTATLAARLIEQGRLSWDTTLAEGLPDLVGQMQEAHKGIKLRQLLGHRAGIAGHEANVYAMAVLWGIEQEKDKSMRQKRTSAATAILRAPVSEIGQFKYSNYGYVLAGAMCERAGGASWEELMAREVFGPLGITTAGFGPPPRIRGHMKVGEAFKPQERDNPLLMGPAGTVHMSLGDWAKFAAAHLGQVEGYLRPETLAAMHEPLEGEGPAYAMGWGVRKDEQGRIVQLSHAGSNTLWYALIVLEPSKGRARLAAASAVGDQAVSDAIGALAESAAGGE